MEFPEVFSSSTQNYPRHDGSFDADVDIQNENNSYIGFNVNNASQSYTNSIYQHHDGIIRTTNDFEPIVDPEEAARRQKLEEDEENRRDKLRNKLNTELEKKQELRDKARSYLDQWKEQRNKTVEQGKENNKINEEEFIQQRKIAKESKNNPWDLVVSNLTLKESEYKGSKDVSRMRTCIINRKSDFVQMKMK